MRAPSGSQSDPWAACPQKITSDYHIVAALAYIGEKSRGISPSRGIYRLSLLINMIFTLYFEVSPGISWDPTRWGEVLLEGVGYGLPFSNPVRVSLHFSSSRGIQLDLSRPHPLHEMFSPSRGISRQHPPTPRRTSLHLVGSHEMRRNSHGGGGIWVK